VTVLKKERRKFAPRDYLFSLPPDKQHCKDTILEIGNKYSQKRKCADTVPIVSVRDLRVYVYSHDQSAYSAAGK
jgi:hypothetical protein